MKVHTTMRYDIEVGVESRFREFLSKLGTEMPILRAQGSNIQNFMN